MASLVLTVAGYAVGGPIGALVGSFAGSFIDRKLFAPPPVNINNTQEGPRLTDLFVTSSSEGAPVLRVIGRMRVSPQMIWATNFREVVTVSTQTQTSGGGGGKGGGGGGASSTVTTTTTTYSYFVSFALGLCEGPIVGIGGVWADGKPLDMSQYTFRLYKGDETQGPDPKIAAVEGAGRVPGFRGLAYLVFEEMPLEKFGNRIPQITVEVIRRPSATGVRLEDVLTAVTIIPGLGEFVYATDTVYRSDGLGHSVAENRHGSHGKSDFLVALDQLQASAPNVNAVSLVVAWHGTDLRCSNCEIKPKVEFGASKVTTPWSWQVSGIGRGSADVVSSDSFGALLGGAPADRSVVQAITELKARGFRVVLYPFVMMDIPAGNGLTNPYSDNAAASGQPVFPWRGRITCSPAPGYAGTVDKTAAAASQIDAFFGAAAPSDFGAWNGDTIPYSGPNEWSYRRFILHYAKLAVAAGGVDAFLIGSEMVALNRVRSGASTFPAVSHMVALAADVRTIVGSSCKVGYAADWSEYANFRPDDGSNDVYFHLDPLWASANIDFVGVDNYMPLSDWRSGRLHLDAQAGVPSIYAQSYLQGNIEGGELFDWFYASGEDRKTQTRTPVTDGAYGKPWVFRFKDFYGWWANQHYDRPGGVESASPTAWVPQSKPIWFTEFGCPAIDKGSNQPNVFYDPKSSESVLPYVSTGRRDDLIQRAFLEAHITYWNPAAGHNPTSSVYGGPMIDPASLFAWTWDARPYPRYPNSSLIWRDAANWRRGHWLSGRLGLVTLADTVQEICSGLGVSIDTSGVNGIVRGYTIDSIMSPRNALSPLMQVYFFDAVESGRSIRFVQRGGSPVASVTMDDLVDSGNEDKRFYTLTRAQETDLPETAHLRFLDPDNDYQSADVYSRRLRGSSRRTIELTPALALDYSEAQGIADALLVDTWVMRERADLTLPPSAYALEPTDVVTLDLNGRSFEMRIEQLGYERNRPARLVRTDEATYGAPDAPSRLRQPRPEAEPGPAVLHIMDLPVLTASEIAGVPRLAAYAEPWARVDVFRSPATSGFVRDQFIVNRATIGRTLFDFYSGPVWTWDMANSLYVQLPSTQALTSLDDAFVLAGGNTCAIQNADGEWEILQFASAELIAPDQYRLTRLIRGQLGSEYAMRDPVGPGAPFVMLDATVVQSTIAVTERHNPWTWKWGPSTKAIDDPTFRAVTFSFDGVGLRPYSPVHLAGARDPATFDWTLSWIRRTRIDGDNWEAPDVPLGEEVELYDLDIIDIGTGAVRRTARVNQPAFLYTATMQAADFGTTQSQVKFAVYQISLAYGHGTGAIKTVP
ncbi:Putative phage tail protein/GTA TIM-barrel-like domain [Chelatococcus sambhunathii]|uniref:Phage tail protein/GTA TIM-barrel-like domain n=1 Tax=Chelatococcus sambhunathii TaxID=363953 RepID=A0ABM9U955_9HYPH|nr:glycoside hydrolase/phage tail family protein [Chelatococcus sambhunathii]CUA90595.1 Putative phage tail protein/GTA TIM-barrel-like domain [Chelatococcus sambhunathii]